MTKIQTNCLKKKNYPRNYSKKKSNKFKETPLNEKLNRK